MKPAAPTLKVLAFLTFLTWITPSQSVLGQDKLAAMQSDAIATAKTKKPRPYHFGSQGAGDVFSNHASHSNRLIPVYTFGTKVDLASVTGPNSKYRSEAGIRSLFAGQLPPNTLNPTANYADQSDLYQVQKNAVEKGVKYLFIVWFDGMDWDTTRAAAIAKSGQLYHKGKGSGLIFQDYPKGNPQFTYVVTTPTHDKNTPDVNKQSIAIPGSSLAGGYDAEIAGHAPWALGPLGAKAPGYLKGQSANAEDSAGVKSVNRVMHAYTDSSSSAGEVATGKKQYNNGVNVTEDGKFAPTLFLQLQEKGWKAGTVTSVPFSHASPAAMYAHNVHRDDYQDLSRDMLGLKSVAQAEGKESQHPGLDVVIGTGFGKTIKPGDLTKAKGIAGENVEVGNAFITAKDLHDLDAKNGGKYVVVTTAKGVNGGKAVAEAAKQAADGNKRLFGFFGDAGFDHLPFRTANGDFTPVKGIRGSAESYSKEELESQPTLAQLTDAALTVLAAKKGQPFTLFVEAGDVDFALHDNNLDNAVGAVYSGEAAIAQIIKWVEANSNWDDSAMIVTADHGQYLVVDDPNALTGAGK